jgi:hypothetical protein
MPKQARFDMLARIKIRTPADDYETTLLNEFDQIRALLRHVELSEVPSRQDDNRVASTTIAQTVLH